MVKVVSLCDRTGNMVRPWLEAGHEAITVDIQPAFPINPRHRHIRCDVRALPEHWGTGSAIVFAFPPCTHLAVSGARWFKEKGMGKLIEALQIVEACRKICETSGSPWMLENPVGTLATYWRDPDYTFDPCDYGDPYTKKTCIWCGNGFVMPQKVAAGDMFAEATMVEPTMGSIMHLMPPSKDRGDKRSITPMGFAQAVLEANVHGTGTVACRVHGWPT
jgi:hypothetical protein